jgi:hypothetical protein
MNGTAKNKTKQTRPETDGAIAMRAVPPPPAEQAEASVDRMGGRMSTATAHDILADRAIRASQALELLSWALSGRIHDADEYDAFAAPINEAMDLLNDLREHLNATAADKREAAE